MTATSALTKSTTTARRAADIVDGESARATIFENFDVLAETAGSVPRLRQMILDLAIRGRLSRPEPDDDEVSGEPGAPCTEAHELPPRWKWRRLGGICRLNIGRTPPTKHSEYWGPPAFPWVSIGDMPAGGRIKTTARWVSARAAKDVFRGRVVPKGTLLMSFKLTIGKVAILDFDGFHNEAIVSIFPGPHVSQEYLLWILPRVASGGDSKNALMGATLNSGSLDALPIPLPPVSEQKRIVARVDQLMDLCDELEARLTEQRETGPRLTKSALDAVTTAEGPAVFDAAWRRVVENFSTLLERSEQVAELKDAILSLALRGRLVPQLSGDESAQILLSKVLARREAAFKGRLYRRPKQLPPLVPTNGLFPIPPTWAWVRLGDLCFNVGDGPHFSPKYVSPDEGVPFLSARNVTRSGIELSTVKYVSREDHELFCKRTKPEQGDILYVKGGVNGGVAAVNTLEIEFSVWVHLAVLKLVRDQVLPEFVAMALSSPYCFQQSKAQTHGIGNLDIGLTRLVLITIPLPPLAEQRRIVARVEQLIAICDSLENRLRIGEGRADALADAIMQELFE